MIEIRDLEKFYGPVKAVDNIALSIPEGQVLGLLGPNGSGKTSTLRMITGFLTPSAGQVKVGGVDVMEDPLKVKKMIGYLPESAPLYTNMLVYDCLSFVARSRGVAPDQRHRRVEQAARRCALLDYMSRPINQLSKGYRQRVGLAMTMIDDPKVLILDEPTTGLDPNQILEIRGLIREIGREKTVIFSTHILSEAEQTCDRIVIINKGRIIADDTAGHVGRGAIENAELQLLLAQADSAEVKARLRDLAGVLQVECEPEGAYLRVRVLSESDIRLSLAQLLKEQPWLPVELREVKRSLEDVFRQLTDSTELRITKTGGN